MSHALPCPDMCFREEFEIETENIFFEDWDWDWDWPSKSPKEMNQDWGYYATALKVEAEIWNPKFFLIHVRLIMDQIFFPHQGQDWEKAANFFPIH